MKYIHSIVCEGLDSFTPRSEFAVIISNIKTCIIYADSDVNWSREKQYTIPDYVIKENKGHFKGYGTDNLIAKVFNVSFQSSCLNKLNR